MNDLLGTLDSKDGGEEVKKEVKSKGKANKKDVKSKGKAAVAPGRVDRPDDAPPASPERPSAAPANLSNPGSMASLPPRPGPETPPSRKEDAANIEVLQKDPSPEPSLERPRVAVASPAPIPSTPKAPEGVP